MSEREPWEVVEDRVVPGEWRVERIGLDGECFVTIFCGPAAEKRAREYHEWVSAHVVADADYGDRAWTDAEIAQGFR